MQPPNLLNALAPIALALAACAPMSQTPMHQHIPSELTVPQGHVAHLSLIGKGVQIYVCQATRDAAGYDQFDWVFKAPQAKLVDNAGQELGSHGAGPFWQHNDGSKIVGEVKARAASPDTNAIPLLLLAVKSREGQGVFARTTFVQRLDTVGGKAPLIPCTSAANGKETRVDYLATYVFFKPSEY